MKLLASHRLVQNMKTWAHSSPPDKNPAALLWTPLSSPRGKPAPARGEDGRPRALVTPQQRVLPALQVSAEPLHALAVQVSHTVCSTAPLLKLALRSSHASAASRERRSPLRPPGRTRCRSCTDCTRRRRAPVRPHVAAVHLLDGVRP